ncbi:hypothetical protein MSPP1_001229 [Malassezia sp. CBS 17886]|nr:hypothetical protein MSPP1_001229 [Malassezia sp. CBS 17886]
MQSIDDAGIPQWVPCDTPPPSAPHPNTRSWCLWGDMRESDSGDEHDSASESHSAMLAARSVGRWEADMDVPACRQCARRFTLFFRKCTLGRAHLAEADIVIDPEVPEMLAAERVGPSRVCTQCIAEHRLEAVELAAPAPSALDTLLFANMFSVAHGRTRTAATADTPDRASDASRTGSISEGALEECPVCERPLRTLRTAGEREAHVMHCLEHGAPAHVAAPRARYLASKLTGESALLGKECIICMEEFAINDMVARLNCLCCYHCIWWVAGVCS